MGAVISKDVLTSVFKRSGGEGLNTKLFESFSIMEKQKLLRKVLLESSEEPVLASVRDDENWCLLTTNRFIWSKRGEIQGLDFDQLTDATIDSSLAIQRKVSNAAELRDLKLITKHDGDITIEIEAGFSFSGMWNTLKFLATRNGDPHS